HSVPRLLPSFFSGSNTTKGIRVTQHHNKTEGREKTPFKMLFLGNLVYVLCLLTNALAILSDDRFLARIGLSTSTYDPAFGAGADANSVKAKLVALIASVRMVMRPPLIIVNTLIILYELVLG
ncbi:Protein transport protein YOS1, partial [Trichoderma lentiforme]